ncbi:MAG: hypothetical protein GY943_11580 [Chloroflexi bacterium]|nr:hypothetical protein [Chloroflexota bacterium]
MSLNESKQIGSEENGRKRPFFSCTLFVYVGFILIWWLLRWMFKDSLWWLALINSYALGLFLPVPIFLLLGMWKGRTKRPLLFLLIPIGLFLWLYGVLFWPNGQVGDGNGRTITAMSYNILVSNNDHDAIIASILAADADIVGLQEVTEIHAKELGDRLLDEYPYQIFPPPVSKRINIALLSKFPVTQTFSFPFPPRKMGMHVVVDVDGQPVHLFVAHLIHNGLANLEGGLSFAEQAHERFTLRSVEVTHLKLEMADISDPVLFLCDCNLTETSQAYVTLDSVLDDSFRETGWGFGLTSFVLFDGMPPLNRIDYVWHSDRLTAVSTKIGERGGSDHLPIIATLQLSE